MCVCVCVCACVCVSHEQPNLHFAVGGRELRVFDSVPTNKVREPPSCVRYSAHFNSFLVAMGSSVVEFDGKDGTEKNDRFEVHVSLSSPCDRLIDHGSSSRRSPVTA